MPTIQASFITGRAATILQDVTNIRWPASELRGWASDGQREIVLAKPDACVVTKAVQQAAGTKQALGTGTTADAILLLKPVRNMGTAGTTPGKAIRLVSAEILDAQIPDWHSQAASSEVTHVVYDPRVPKQYYVYPPNTGTGWIELAYSASPASLTTDSDVLSVDDVFANALIDYVLYRAYSKDVEYAGDASRAVAHYQAFANSLGLNTQNLAVTNPNAQNAGMNPNVAGSPK